MSSLIKSIFSNVENYYCLNTDPKNESEIYHCLLVNNDKIVFLTEIKELKELDEYTMKLPELKNIILNQLLNGNETKYVTSDAKIIDIPKQKYIGDSEKSIFEKRSHMTIPAFLWDLYVVGFFKVDDNKYLPVDQVERIKRDQFIARKIVVEYTNEEDLYNRFNENIYPDQMMNSMLEDLKPPIIEIQEVLDNIDINNIAATHEHFKGLTVKDIDSTLIIKYLDDIIDKYKF